MVLLQTPEQAGDSSTYWGQNIRMMPLASIDPSLAIGFYCRSLGAALLAVAVLLALHCMAQNRSCHVQLCTLGRSSMAYMSHAMFLQLCE